MQIKTKNSHKEKFSTKKQFAKNKISATLLALFLMSAIAIPLIALPTASAHTPGWQIPTWAYLSVAPNPIGVGQRLFVVLWLDAVLPGAAVENDIRFHNYTLTITLPDGKTEVKSWPVVTDTVSSQALLYYPQQVGKYTFVWEFPGQVYTWNQANSPGLSAANAAYENDSYLPSKSKTIIVNVQQEKVYEPPTSYPMPTEYFTRPIEGQNTDWWRISSNWLGRQSPQLAEERLRNTDDGYGPDTPHVMWAKPIQEGGVVGGTNNFVPGEGYYIGTTYNRRFNNPIIMYGILYYTEPQSIEVTTTTSGGQTKAVDLRTGQEIWSQRIPGPDNIFEFGYVYTSGDNPNMHGTWPGILFTADFRRAYDALTGNWMFNVTNIPVTRAISPTTSVGTETLGDDGTVYLYQINAAKRWLAQWNSSKLWTWGTTPTIPPVVDASVPITPIRPTGAPPGQAYSWNGTAWALVPSSQATQINPRYDWNVTIPSTLPTNARIIYTIMDDMVLLSNITTATGFGPSASGTQAYMVAALSLKPESRGNLLWIKNYPQPQLTRSLYGKLVNEENRIFLAYDKETSEIQGYSLDNGEHLWTSTLPLDSSDFILYSYLGAIGLQTAYGLVYFGGYGGIMHAFNITTGKLVWTYGNGGPGNTTYSGTGLAYGRFPIYPGPIVDGILYLDTGEHSAQPPLYKGALVRAINATTGEEIWTLPGWGGHHRREGFAAADGYLVYLNHYDMRIYSVGKGPSATTVSTPSDVQPLGRSVLIRGSVTDIAAGTKQSEQAARFPTGVPAVSDVNMSAWMEYIYMQKPRPKSEDIIGVNVSFRIIDPNGNIYDIGETTTDSNGMYSYMWKPEVPGKYTVIATFSGSKAFWPSYAETAVGVDQAQSAAPITTPTPTLAPTTAPTTPPATTTTTTAPSPTSGIAIETFIAIAAVVIIAIVTAAALVLRRRK